MGVKTSLTKTGRVGGGTRSENQVYDMKAKQIGDKKHVSGSEQPGKNMQMNKNQA